LSKEEIRVEKTRNTRGFEEILGGEKEREKRNLGDFS